MPHHDTYDMMRQFEVTNQPTQCTDCQTIMQYRLVTRLVSHAHNFIHQNLADVIRYGMVCL